MDSESGADEAALFWSYANVHHINPDLAKQMLKEAKDIMDSLGVPFFLRQGTCLGAVRDQAFIPWDDDIDLGCVIGLNGVTEDMIAPVLNAFRDHGYFVNEESNDRWIAAGMMKSSLRIDLTFFRIIDDNIFHFPFIWMPARLFASLKEIEFMGGNYLVPNPPEEYLRIKYGPDWVTPKVAYEQDVLDQVAKSPVAKVAPSQGQLMTKVTVLDQRDELVRGAEVSVVGLAETSTNDDGYAEFGLPYKDFYMLVIKFDDHKEILYQELMSPGASYIYTPDPSINNGRLMVLSEELENGEGAGPARDVGYVSKLYGGFWNFDIKDFCYMTNSYFPPQEFIDSMAANLRVLVKSYPSTNWHISSLVAKPLGLTHDEVVIANGASELIAAITGRFVENLAVPVPTFDEFVNRAGIQGKRVSPYQLAGDFDLDVEGFIQHVQETQSNAILLINPNNPSGSLVTRESMIHLLESLRLLDVVIVDESFIDFVTYDPAPSVMDMIFDFPNLVVLKSLSKTYGIPGLRLGYAVSGNREVTASLRSDIPIWSINSLSQYFLEQIGPYQQQFVDSCIDVRRATQAMFSDLQGIPYLHPYPTQANYVMCKILYGFTAPQLTACLFEKFNILINDLSSKKGLDDRFVRIASRTEEENVQLVQCLRSLASTISREDRAYR